MRELCGMQVKTDRSSLKMRVTTSIFIAAMLVLFVYCLSAGAVFTSGIEYIDKNRNQKSENSLWTYICENESTCTRKNWPKVKRESVWKHATRCVQHYNSGQSQHTLR
ncbi:hypothetical protein NQ317_015605 [Molorchus minor]|uniref:Uncharacterized protein n=1 Tax=Molorchus minor TaxID=1323400 RepID=A0ABQ9JY21_9CUCU|nr:hypothetical protein NQ317_015605 [Molorchus minor]